MLAVFGIGGWEILLILIVFSVMAAIVVGVILIALMAARRQKQPAPSIAIHAQVKEEPKE